MKPSDLPAHYKLGMIVAFIAVMGAWSWLVHGAIYKDWLPDWLVDLIGLMILVAVVITLGRYYLLPKLRRNRLPTRTE